MSDITNALALPGESNPPELPPGSGYGFGSPGQQPPSHFGRFIKRFWLPLFVCGLLSALIAYLIGQLFGKPVWQAESTLLYQPVALTEKQKLALEHPPGLPTLASWIREPALMREINDEFRLGLKPTDLAEKYITVDQPLGTETVNVGFKWTDVKTAEAVLNRLLEKFMDYVVTVRKETILLRLETMDRQTLASHEDEVKRLNNQIQSLEDKLARTGQLGEEDMDAIMLARRGELKDTIRRAEQKRAESSKDLQFKLIDLPIMEDLVKKSAEAPTKLRALQQEIDKLRLDLNHQETLISEAAEELRTLPIYVAKGKRYDLLSKSNWLKGRIQQYDDAKAALGKRGGPSARGPLEGMDAREFTVKQPARVGERPASSNRKPLMALTFLGLMGCVCGLLIAYDRRHPASKDATGDPYRARVVHVTPPGAGPSVTIAEVDSNRLSVRIHQWIQNTDSSIVTPPLDSRQPRMITEGEGRDVAPPVKPDPARMAKRISDWIEKKKE